MNVALCLVLACGGLRAGQPMTAGEAFKESDAIALVLIRNVGPLGSDGKYSKTAVAEVYESVKGLKSGETFSLDFGTDSSVGNVDYQIGEKAIVFLRKLSNGHYETRHDYCGKFSVEHGEVLDCYPLAEAGKIPEAVALDQAIQKLRVLVSETKEY